MLRRGLIVRSPYRALNQAGVIRVVSKALLATVAMAAGVLTAASASAAPELLTNGGFESGDFTGWSVLTYPSASVNTFAWAKTKSGSVKILPEDGTYFARLVGHGCINCQNPLPNGYLSQTVTGLTVGEGLDLTYWENDTGSGKTAPLVLKFGSSTGPLDKYLPIAIGAAVNGWQEYGATFLATGTSDTISFQWQTAPTYFYGLDDVSLVDPPAPEPATWALMLVGFGGIGATMRSRRNRVVRASA